MRSRRKIKEKLHESAVELIEARLAGDESFVETRMAEATPQTAAFLAVAVEHGLRTGLGRSEAADQWVLWLEERAIASLAPAPTYRQEGPPILKLEGEG